MNVIPIRQKRTTEVRIPEGLTARFEAMVQAMTMRLAEPPQKVRRAVEQAMIKRGLEALEREMGR